MKKSLFVLTVLLCILSLSGCKQEEKSAITDSESSTTIEKVTGSEELFTDVMELPEELENSDETLEKNSKQKDAKEQSSKTNENAPASEDKREESNGNGSADTPTESNESKDSNTLQSLGEVFELED